MSKSYSDIREAVYKEAVDIAEQTDEPASEDEAGMAMDQAKFIGYVAEEIIEYLQGNNDFPEWMQNKLTGFHEKAKDMHAVMAGKYESVQEATAKFTDKQIKMAYGIANDKRYKGGNYAGAVRAIEKIAKGLSDHPDVKKVLKVTNESLRSDIAKLSAKFPEGSKVKMKHNGKVAKVISVGRDFVKVAVGNKTMDHKPSELEKLDEAVDFMSAGKYATVMHPKTRKLEKILKTDLKKYVMKGYQHMGPIKNRVTKSMFEETIEEKAGKYNRRGDKELYQWGDINQAMMDSGLNMRQILKVMTALSHARVGYNESVTNEETVAEATMYLVKMHDGSKHKKTMDAAAAEKMKKNPDVLSVSVIGNVAEESITEKLKVSDGMSTWIKDFQASDAPQFKGKSDKERRDMAIAAYMSAKRDMKESAVLDEALDSIITKIMKMKGNAESIANSLTPVELKDITRNEKEFLRKYKNKNAKEILKLVKDIHG